MRKILVTGATGFVGNYVIEELLRKECLVVASSLNLEKAKSKKWFEKVKYIQLDFSLFDEKKDYYNYFGYPDGIIHLAWEGLPNYRSSYHLTINLPRHFLFLSNLIEHGLKDVTITGTCFEYGMLEGKLTETMDAQPDNPYAIAKDTLRKQLESLKAHQKFEMKWLRLFYMFGQGQNSNSLLSQLDNALQLGLDSFNMSGGQQIRDFLPIEKIAEYVVNVALQRSVTGIINCCSGEPITVKQLVEKYLREKNAAIELNLGYYPYPDYEPMKFWGDNSKLKSILSINNNIE